MLGLLEDLYREVKGVRRDLRPSDDLREDLGLDSLAAAEVLTALEDELGVALVEDSRTGHVKTVGDVIALIARPGDAPTLGF